MRCQGNKADFIKLDGKLGLSYLMSEEYRLWLCEDKVKKTLGLKRQEVKKEWRDLHEK
jgi:hypothetical protein